MKLIIRKGNSKYELSFDVITQLCGSNIPLKSFIINSICKHFSSEKYKEYEEDLIDNVEIGGEVPGRKQWECYLIASTESIISAIQMNKGSILGKCMKEYVGEFDCQNELVQIDDILLRMFERLNKTVLLNESIEIQYTKEDLFDMLLQTSVRTVDGRDIHVLENAELLNILLDIINKQQQLLPEKRLYIFENIDHLISKDEYIGFVLRCQELTKESNVWFIFSTSLDEYVYLDEATIENVNIINEDVFIIPSLEHLLSFVDENYPVEERWDEGKLIDVMAKLVQKIGRANEMIQPLELVILKLINETNDIKKCWKKSPKTAEIQCLMDENVI